MLKTKLLTEEDTQNFAKRLAACLPQSCFITFSGQLGAGKTTLCRGILQGLGHEGSVKSPTYTIVEPYEINHQSVLHFDLYRVEDPQELEMFGIRDYFSEPAVILLEWPEQAGDLLPKADIHCNMLTQENYRECVLSANTSVGKKILENIQ